MSDPKKVMIDGFGGLIDGIGALLYSRASGIASEVAPDATIYKLRNDSQPEEEEKKLLQQGIAHDPVLIQQVVQQITQHSQEYGKIDELYIAGHGMKNYTKIGSRGLNTKEFLKALEKQQTSLPERIVFLGCSVFSDLSVEDEKFYTSFAKKYGVEIVGSTSFNGTLFGDMDGHFWAFQSDGTVKKDKLYEDFSVFIPVIKGDHLWTNKYSLPYETLSIEQLKMTRDALLDRTPILKNETDTTLHKPDHLLEITRDLTYTELQELSHTLKYCDLINKAIYDKDGSQNKEPFREIYEPFLHEKIEEINESLQGIKKDLNSFAEKPNRIDTIKPISPNKSP